MMRTLVFLSVVACATLPACARTPEAAAPSAAPSSMPTKQAAEAVERGTPTTSNAHVLPRMTVHKSPSCGCCALWVQHLRKAGFTVEVHHQDNLNPLKERLGVPYGKGSCHTAEVGGYVVEGHVPADDIKRLLAQAPAAKGLVLPGMPVGSPGMEAPDGRTQPYTVELVGHDGSTTAFAQH